MKVFQLLYLVLVAGSAFAGPFGLTAGAKLDQLDVVLPPSRGLYMAKSVPLPHPEFESYMLIMSEKAGLVGIGATPKPFECDNFGDKAKVRFLSLVEALERRYGKGEISDFLRNGSIWNEPRHWLMSLAKGERVLSCEWKTREGNKLPDSILMITLIVKADSDLIKMTLTYYFEGIEEWRAEQRAIRDSRL